MQFISDKYKVAGFISFFVLMNLHQILYPQQIPISRDQFKELRNEQIRTRQQLLYGKFSQPDLYAASSQDNFDVEYYELNLIIDPVKEWITGFVEMAAVAKTDDLNQVWLDFRDNMQVDSVGGQAVSYSRRTDILQLDLDSPVGKNQTFKVRVDYQGHPIQGGFGAFGFNTHDGAPIIWSLSEPYYARSWWPCKDTPADKADSVDMILTVPENLTAVSNGVLVSDTPAGNGLRTFHWQEKYPITTYLVSVAITNYARYTEWFEYAPGKTMPVEYYVYPEKYEDFRNNIPPTLAMLEYFHEIFGAYPFLTEKYGIAQFPWGGGMEHQTITSQGNFGTTLTVHELAHQWWGDKITNQTWGDIWLNEGFASYAEALFYEHLYGKEFYHTYMGYMDYDYAYPIYVDDTTSVSRIFDGTVYDKGAWLLHMLRKVVGDNTFFQILLAYSDDPRFAYKNATTAGFQSVCEQVSGRDLDWFFTAWVYGMGRPVYRINWYASDSLGTNKLIINLQQMQYPQQPVFPMPVEILIYASSGDTIVSVFNQDADQTFHIPISQTPDSIKIDPEDWILKSVDTITNIKPVEFVLLQNYPNPFNSETVIIFTMPNEDQVNASVYNVKGQLVKVLFAGNMDAGIHYIKWDGKASSGSAVSSGLYICQIRTGSIYKRLKMLFVKGPVCKKGAV